MKHSSKIVSAILLPFDKRIVWKIKKVILPVIPRSLQTCCQEFKLFLYFQIDVDIGSSSVARGVVGLVLGYITSVVVDLAILIEVIFFLPTCNLAFGPVVCYHHALSPLDHFPFAFSVYFDTEAEDFLQMKVRNNSINWFFMQGAE